MRRLLLPILGLTLLAACSSLKAVSGPGRDTISSSEEQEQMQMADNAKKSGDLTTAAEMYRQIAAHAKDPLPAQLGLAATYRKLGRPQDAVAVMRTAEAQHHDDPAVLSQLGYALIDSDQPEDAVGYFDRLIALEPDNAMAYNGKGVAFDKAGNHLAAQDIYERALKLAPDSLAIQNNLALSMILNNQFDAAIALLEALNAQPNSTKTVRQNLALAYGLKGDKDKAMALNMQDLPPDEAKENMRFYEQYLKREKKLKPGDAPPSAQIGFAETPEPIKSELKKETAPAPLTAPVPKEKKKAEKTGKAKGAPVTVITAPPPPAVASEDLPAPKAPAGDTGSTSWFGGIRYDYPSQGQH